MTPGRAVIDAHHHLWTADYPWLGAPDKTPIRRDYTVDDLLPHLRAAGVDATVLVEAGRCDLDETRAFLEVADRVPEVAGVVGWVSFVDLAVAATVAALRSEPGGRWLVGVRDQVQAEWDPSFLARSDVRSTLAEFGRAGLVVDLVVRRDQLTTAAITAAALPETTFVLDHLGKPLVAPDELSEWRTAVSPLAACDNVFAKLSGLLTEVPAGTLAQRARAIVPFVDTALELFGPDRLMVGSDWPVCELVAPYGDTWVAIQSCLASLSPDERVEVNGGTAVRTYRLEIPP